MAIRQPTLTALHKLVVDVADHVEIVVSAGEAEAESEVVIVVVIAVVSGEASEENVVAPGAVSGSSHSGCVGRSNVIFIAGFHRGRGNGEWRGDERGRGSRGRGRGRGGE